ncbi:putative ABC1 protein [Platanthera zijinensis]|uniref:ABC1 protein n=1 Tax=Platanthera zijinensis TaxID=2320716 RepID=A0AAP0GFC0_9ASPA
MWRVGAKLAAVAALIGGGAASVAISSSDDLSTAFKICTVVPARLFRDAFTAATIAFDYEYSMRGLKEGSIEWSKAKHEVHNRCAYRLRELCFRNGGIYIKLGQHLGQLELDFLLEARNSEKCLDNFKRFSPHIADCIYAPVVYWDLSTSKVLTMEYMDAAEITDLSTIQSLGIQLSDVSKLISQAFAEMIFRHGFVHCDPHAANMMVRPLPSGRRNFFGKRKPQLILLDHGLYKNLDFATRVNYASLWKALIFADVNGIKENSVKLGAGEDLYVLFAGVLTMKPSNRVIDPAVDHLVLEGNDSDRSELQRFSKAFLPIQVSSSPLTDIFKCIPSNSSLFFTVGRFAQLRSSEHYLLLQRRPIRYDDLKWLGIPPPPEGRFLSHSQLSSAFRFTQPTNRTEPK